MKTKQDDSDALKGTAIRGAKAVVDYSGLLVWSFLYRTGCAIKKQSSKMGKEIGRNAATPFVAIKKQVRKEVRREGAPAGEATERMEKRIAIIEERLADLEKHGVKIVETQGYQKKHKELDEERRGLLALIVEENKELKAQLNK
ncbi:MAG TPA: hypothetical protein HPP58_00215 [Deltaproteobacteria bacterium]|nr:hypothetical protein [Deltaproteobacteria bacterium]HIJ35657.1 hypothetical protein [Deltaproteobacteria bacterium]HIJ39468.1 hypothetical protein [Deltaproteobacteria bacterium]